MIKLRFDGVIMKRKTTIFLLSIAFFVTSFADSFRVNTQSSAFNALKNDECEYDEETNIVHCTKTGSFQKVTKACGTADNAKNQLIGSIIENNKPCNLYAITPQQAIEQNRGVTAIAEKIAQQLFNPVDPSIKPATKNPFPTVSLNANALDATYGSNGLNVSPTLLDYFKKFYFYFEYVVKVEYAARLAALAPQLAVDFVTTLEQSSWQGLVKAMIAKAGSWDALEKKLFDPTLTPQWQAVNGTIDAKTWQDVPQSSFWKSLNNVTTKSLINSTFWQNYLKYTIARTFVQDGVIINSIKQLEQSIFLYIPNIEVAYYHPDFVDLRNGCEMYHLSLILTDAFRLRLLENCSDWNTLKDTKTGTYDLLKIYAAIKDFQATPFYKIAALGETDAASTFNAIAQKKVPDELKLIQEQPTLHYQISLFSMIKILHALTHYIYNKDHLDKTMTFIAQNNKNQSGPQPSILLYSTEDYVYLDDLNHLNDSIEQGVAAQAVHDQNSDPVSKSWNKLVNLQKDNVVVQSWSSFLTDVGTAISDVWDDIEKTKSDAFDALTNAGESLVESFLSGASEIEGGIAKIPGIGEALTGLSPSEADRLLNSAEKLRKHAVDDMKRAGVDLNKVVNDVIETATTAIQGVKGVATELVENIGAGIDDLCNTVLVKQDKELCKDVSGAFITDYEMLIDGLADLANVAVYDAGGMVKLTADAVILIAQTATDLVAGDFKDMGPAIYNGLKQMGIDAAVSLLNQLTYTFKFFYDDIMNALKYAQFFISILTRLFIDASTAAAFVGAGIGWIFDQDVNPFQAAQEARDTLSANERTINAAITTALLLATIPLTGGSSAWVVLPMIAMTVGPQIIQIVTAVQEDELKQFEKDEQHAFVETFSTFIGKSELIFQQQQLEITNELQLRYQAELSNEERNVGFYENFMNKNFEALKEQMSFLLENWWSQLLTPDSYGLAYADVGSAFGIQTGVYDLNPSQGFPVYNAGRASFSQEVAVMPEVVSQGDDNSLLNKKTMSKNWFNQKETIPLSKSVNEIEIRFKPIYLLNTFYIGIYCGGKELNIAALTDKNKSPDLDLDLDHLAKMAVLKRETINKPITINAYEHEGKGWLKETVPVNNFSMNSWYYLNVRLNGTTLQIKFWSEDAPSNVATQSYSVTALPSQKTIGVISSGAAIEYQFIKPIITVKPIPELRPANGYCKSLPTACLSPDDQNITKIITEIAREAEARKLLSYKLTPTVGQFNPKAVTKDQILKGHFIYNTQATHLKNSTNTTINDYIVMGTIKANLSGVSDIGKYPLKDDDVVSLVTQKAFNNDGSDSGIRVTDAFVNYTKAFPLPDSLMSTIQNLQQNYTAQNMKVTFAPFTLQPASKKAIESYHYIYTMPLTDTSGQQLKDTKGNTLLDYLVFVVVAGTSLDPNYQPGLSFTDMESDTNKTYGLLSLVTLNLYGKSNKTPISNGYEIFLTLQQGYTNPPLESDLLAAITTARGIYQQKGTVTPSIPLIKPGGGTQSGGTSTPTGGNKGPDSGKGIDDTTIKPPSGNASDRTSSGTNDDPSNVDFGGN